MRAWWPSVLLVMSMTMGVECAPQDEDGEETTGGDGAEAQPQDGDTLAGGSIDEGAVDEGGVSREGMGEGDTNPPAFDTDAKGSSDPGVGGGGASIDTEGESLGTADGAPAELCPEAPTIGCGDSADACASDLLHEYPCGQTTASGADVDVYVEPVDGYALVTSTVGRTSDGCPAYYAFVRETATPDPEGPGADFPAHRFVYHQLGGGCTGTQQEDSRMEVLEVAVGDPCAGEVAVGCADNRDSDCGAISEGGGAHEVGIYRSDAEARDPNAWFLFNGTGCDVRVSYTRTNTVLDESYTESDVVLGAGGSLQLGVDLEYYNGEQPIDYTLDAAEMLPACDEGECPDGLECIGVGCAAP
jgi:hypothetical protein